MTGFFRTLLAAIGCAVLLAGSMTPGVAQTAALDQQLAGTWRLAQYNGGDTGLGPRAAGVLMIDGHNFALQIVNAAMAPFASDDRRSATAAESAAGGRSSLAFFGSFTASDADHSLVLHIARSSFPNADAKDQEWKVAIAADKLTLTNAQDSGLTLVWTHVPASGGTALPTRGGRHIIGF